MCSPLPLGGYDHQFLEPPLKQWECPICLLTLRAPHLLSCCGVKICQSCIEGVKNKGKPCPKCRQADFFTLLDKELERLIFDLIVHCPLSVSGCGWTGELRYLDKHVSPSQEGECPYVEVECSHGCGQKMMRRDMGSHEKETCSKLPVEIQMQVLQDRVEKVFTKLTEQHETEITALKAKVEELTKTVEDLRKEKDLFSTTIPVFTHSILLIMPKVPNGNIPGVSYYPSDKYVKISGNSKEEMEARTQQFLAEFEVLLPLLQKDTFDILPRFPQSLIQTVVSNCNRSFRACYAINYKKSVELISTNISEHQQAKKLLSEKLSKKIQILRFTGEIECTLTLKVSSVIDEKVDLVIIPLEDVSSPTHRHSIGGFLSLSKSLDHSHKEIPCGVIVANLSGVHKSKDIIHIPNHSELGHGEQFDLLKLSIYNALAEAVLHRANKSVALPAESSGKGAFRSSFVVPAVIESIRTLMSDESHSKNGWSLNDVRITIQDDLSAFDDGWFYTYGNYLAAKYNLE